MPNRPIWGQKCVKTYRWRGKAFQRVRNIDRETGWSDRQRQKDIKSGRSDWYIDTRSNVTMTVIERGQTDRYRDRPMCREQSVYEDRQVKRETGSGG